MSTAIPQIPPRPTRAQDPKTATTAASSLHGEMPRIPPRPINRRLERSVSPQRESFARSPLNETPFLVNHGGQGNSSLYSNNSANASSSDLQRTTSNVALPSIGQEGSEYAEVFGAPEDLSTSPTQTRSVANDLKLHAPKPSLPTSSAKQKFSTVTRTDSGQAAAFGIGRAASEEKEPISRPPLNAKASFASQTSNGTERPPSSQESDHGIPEIGQRVPMAPDAGDVQAPSPSPLPAIFAPGIGFHNDGSKPRHHGRRTSGRGFEGPPGSYGLHGHGIIHHDRFEKAYYEKHPELFKKETGMYHGPLGDGRGEWALSSEDLNKIVRDTASRGAGIGTSPAVMGTPSEQIGFQASEEYTSRMSSPRPQSIGYHVAHSNTSQTHMDSPLRTESFPADVTGRPEFDDSVPKGHSAPFDTALESETEDDDVIHVDAPWSQKRKIFGGFGQMESTEDLEPHTGTIGEEDGINEERGYSAPILASDEVAKEPFGWELQPAVSPMNERRGSGYDDSGYHHRSGSASSLSGSRPTSRPGSIHGTLPGLRLASESTPLEDLDEYEPLFPEDEKAGHAATQKRPLTAADRLKRPEMKNRRFPSQDIWEDTPKSLQYTATVSTPQLPEEAESRPQITDVNAREGETPEQAFARRQEELAEMESNDPESFLNREKKPWAHKAHLGAESKSDTKRRFPSRDIWEDTPDSLQLQTVVSRPQSEDKDVVSPPEERPTTGAPGFALGGEDGRATTGIAATLTPQVPARPAKSKSADTPGVTQLVVPERPVQRLRHVSPLDGASPPLPSKPKPQVPVRPSKPITRDSSENIPLAKVTSNSSAKSVSSDHGSVAAAKPKPPVPSRQVGSKIAALQGGFMSDLNKRLQLGPQAPKKEELVPEEPEEEKEKAPLADARKGRARGPARRAPAKSPAPSGDLAVEQTRTWGFSTPATLWHIDPDEGSLHVASHHEGVVRSLDTKAAQGTIQSHVANVTGQGLDKATETASNAKKSESLPLEDDPHAEQLEEAPKEVLSTGYKKEEDADPVILSDAHPVATQSDQAPEHFDEEGLAGSIAKADDENVEL